MHGGRSPRGYSTRGSDAVAIQQASRDRSPTAAPVRRTRGFARRKLGGGGHLRCSKGTSGRPTAVTVVRRAVRTRRARFARRTHESSTANKGPPPQIAVRADSRLRARGGGEVAGRTRARGCGAASADEAAAFRDHRGLRRARRVGVSVLSARRAVFQGCQCSACSRGKSANRRGAHELCARATRATWRATDLYRQAPQRYRDRR